MAKDCIGCDDHTPVTGVCRACELLDNNTARRLVYWCSLCAAYLCKKCKQDPVRRVMSFVKEKKEEAESFLSKATKRVKDFLTDEDDTS